MFQPCGFKPGYGDLFHSGFIKGCTKPGCLFINVTAQELHRCGFDCPPRNTIATTHGNLRWALVVDLIFEAPQGRRDKKRKSVQMKFCLLLVFLCAWKMQSRRLGISFQRFYWTAKCRWRNSRECRGGRNGNTWGFIYPKQALDGWEMNPSFSRALERHYSCSR